MKTASDVNVIFAFGDSTHFFHKKVCLHMAKHIKNNYLLLLKVKSHFIYTYSNQLKDCVIIIDKSIREYKKKRNKSPFKTYKPSHLAISAAINKLIDNYIIEKANISNFCVKSAKKFVNSLLTKYSIPTLYENDKLFGEFREEYLVESEEKAMEIINRFLKFFRNFEVMNIEQYTTYESWMDKIKKSSKKVFDNKQDYEDIIIAAEYFAYNAEISQINFFTTDQTMGKSIPKISKEYSQKTGKITII